jgi:hypothetical protein
LRCFIREAPPLLYNLTVIIHDFQTGFHPEFLKAAPKFGAAENQKLRFFPNVSFQLCGVDGLPAAKARFSPSLSMMPQPRTIFVQVQRTEENRHSG